MAYHKFVPVPVIDTVFILTALFAAASAFVGIKRLWSGMKAQAGTMKSTGSLVRGHHRVYYRDPQPLQVR